MTLARWSTLAGGVLVGLSATLLQWLKGRVAGSAACAVAAARGRRTARHVPARARPRGRPVLLPVPGAPPLRPEFSRAALALAVAGLPVGFGTRMGNGSASGHGVCGLGRLSMRSFGAVVMVMVMATAIAATYAVRHVWGHEPAPARRARVGRCPGSGSRCRA